jgi:hypothetical protein
VASNGYLAPAYNVAQGSGVSSLNGEYLARRENVTNGVTAADFWSNESATLASDSKQA